MVNINQEPTDNPALNPWGATIESRNIPFLRTFSGERVIVLHEIKGRPGFLVGINAGTHGKEETSVVAALEISRDAAHELVSGTVTSIPVANPDGLMIGTRGVPYVEPGEESDINRNFGKKPNMLIEQHANAIIQAYMSAYEENQQRLVQTYGDNYSGPTGIIFDLHTESGGGGSNSEDVMPYIRLDNTNDDNLLAFVMSISTATGIPWVLDYPAEEYEEIGLDHSLSGTLMKNGIPSMTIELGPEGRTDSRFVNIGKGIAHRIFKQFKMRARDQKEDENIDGDWGQDPSNFVNDIPKINSDAGPLQIADAYCVDKDGNKLDILGFLDIVVKPGDFANKGDLIGFLNNPLKLTDNKIPVYAPFDSWVLSVAGSPNVRYQPGYLAYQAAVQVTDERILKIYNRIK